MRIPIMNQTDFLPGKPLFQGQRSLMIPERLRGDIQSGRRTFFDSPNHRTIVIIEPGIESPEDTWDVTVDFQDESGRRRTPALSAIYSGSTWEPDGNVWRLDLGLRANRSPQTNNNHPLVDLDDIRKVRREIANALQNVQLNPHRVSVDQNFQMVPTTCK